MKFINKRMWYRKTRPKQPSHVTNFLRIASKPCHRFFNKDIGIPLSQQLIFLDVKNNLHITSSTLVFLNHFFPLNGRPVAWPKNSSVTLTWMSPTLAQQPSKYRENSWAVCKLKPWSFSRNLSHPWPLRSSLASSHRRRVCDPLGLILMTRAMGILKEDNKT